MFDRFGKSWISRESQLRYLSIWSLEMSTSMTTSLNQVRSKQFQALILVHVLLLVRPLRNRWFACYPMGLLMVTKVGWCSWLVRSRFTTLALKFIDEDPENIETLRYMYKTGLLPISCQMWTWSYPKPTWILPLSTLNCVWRKFAISSDYLTWMAIDQGHHLDDWEQDDCSRRTLIWKKVWTIGCRTLTAWTIFS